MKKFVKVGATVGSAAALAVVGAAFAYANWSVGSGTIKAKVKTVTMPAFGFGPTLQVKNKKVTVLWVAQKIEPAVRVQGYLVTRHDSSGGSVEVCGGLVTDKSCKDLDVPDGTYTYTVRTVQGLWQGPDSPASPQAAIGTGVTTSGLMIAPPPNAGAPTTPAADDTPDDGTGAPAGQEDPPGDSGVPGAGPTSAAPDPTPSVSASSGSATPPSNPDPGPPVG